MSMVAYVSEIWYKTYASLFARLAQQHKTHMSEMGHRQLTMLYLRHAQAGLVGTEKNVIFAAHFLDCSGLPR